MSGLELAGLVLGAFPVLLGALKKNKEACEMLGDWWKVCKHYELCLKEVKAEYNMFKMNLRSLLNPILEDSTVLEQFLTDPYGEHWQSESISNSMKQLLPTVYESYFDKMETFHNHMIALGHELGINKQAFQHRIAAGYVNPGRGQGAARDILEFEWHRIKFSVNRKRRKVLLTELTRCNEYLERFSDSLLKSTSPVQSGISRNLSMPPSLLGFWQHARDLYHLMQRAWSCSCTSHSTDLLLRDHRDPHKVEFNILFTFAENITAQHLGSWDWKEADVVAFERDETQRQSLGDQNIVNAISSTQGNSRPALKSAGRTQGSKQPKGVSFMTNIIPMTNLVASLPLQAGASLPEITDLCADLTKLGPDDNELGILGKSSKGYTVSFPRKKSYVKSDLRHFTLDEILRSKLKNDFSRRQRYTVALAIASSYVQLQATPWIWTQWDKRSIYLLYDSSEEAFLEQPRIARNISKQLPASPGRLDRSIVALGIMLLELAFGEAVEENRFRLKHPRLNNLSDQFLDEAAAKEWCESQAKENHPQFAKPVLWCLGHETARTAMDLNNDTWRRDLYENVVQPISACCRFEDWEIKSTS